MTVRQRAFLAAYLAGSWWNATAAARQAGYAWLSKQGPRLLTMPAIAAAVAEERRRRAEEWERQREAERAARLREEVRAAWEAQPAWYRLGLPAAPRRRARGDRIAAGLRRNRAVRRKLYGEGPS